MQKRSSASADVAVRKPRRTAAKSKASPPRAEPGGPTKPVSHDDGDRAVPAALKHSEREGLAVPQRVLVAEDNPDTRQTLKTILEMALSVTVDTVADGAHALQALNERSYSVVVTDLKMPHVSGMQLIEEVMHRRLPVTVIVTTGFGSIEEAVKAMQLGAYEFLTKPTNPEHLCLVVQRALRERALQDEVGALRQQLESKHGFLNVLSKSPRMHEIFELIGHVARANTTVLIEGETGTGKEQIARAIHQASASLRSGEFVPVNCAALPETLLESELFGHEKGAYTGAVGQRRGRFEQAHGGTIFLDEVGDIPMPMQAKLLRVLQERKFERIGSNDSIEVDVRVIGATNKSLTKMVRELKFREDLFYRLNVIKIDVPPLRERTEDIRLLATHFTQKYAIAGQPPCSISAEAMEVLLAFDWPGNVRQLENAIERASVTTADGVIRPDNLPPEVCRKAAPQVPAQVDLSRPLPAQVAELTANFEERYLRRALRKTRGHVGRCAKLSGLSRRSVTEKIAQYKIDKNAFKRE
jgi:DNA-binding NtrC family response regulator